MTPEERNLYDQLRKARCWDRAAEFKEDRRRQLREAGVPRREANLRAWTETAEKFLSVQRPADRQPAGNGQGQPRAALDIKPWRPKLTDDLVDALDSLPYELPEYDELDRYLAPVGEDEEPAVALKNWFRRYVPELTPKRIGPFVDLLVEAARFGMSADRAHWDLGGYDPDL